MTQKRIVQVEEIPKRQQQVYLVLVLYQPMTRKVEGAIRRHQELEGDR